MRKVLTTLLLTFLAAPALAQVTIPYSFTAGTTIRSAEVNSNFSTLGSGALNRAGGTITGTIAVDSGITIDGLDLSAAIANKASTATITGAWTFSASPTLGANLLFTDATYDIGASGATRPRDLFLSRNAVVGGTLAVTGVPTFSATTMSLRGITYTLPSADAGVSGYALTSNASGTLSWASAGTTLTDSASLRTALSDETGTGAAVFASTPTLVTPVLGAATGTSLVLSGAMTAGSTITAKGATSSPVVTMDTSADTLTLADTATATFSMTTGYVFIYDGSNGEDAMFAIGNNTSRIVSQKGAVWAATSTASKSSVEGSGGTVTIRNRTGSSVNYKAVIFKVS